jgi:hypothetical protein
MGGTWGGSRYIRRRETEPEETPPKQLYKVTP